MERFELALRTKMRFETMKGMLSTEDLFDLSLEQLDDACARIDTELEKKNKKSRLQEKSTEVKSLEIKLELVEYVMEAKKKEQQARLNERLIREEEQKLLSILAAKKDEELLNMSAEDIEAKIEGLRK